MISDIDSLQIYSSTAVWTVNRETFLSNIPGSGMISDCNKSSLSGSLKLRVLTELLGFLFVPENTKTASLSLAYSSPEPLEVRLRRFPLFLLVGDMLEAAGLLKDLDTEGLLVKAFLTMFHLVLLLGMAAMLLGCITYL